MTTLMRAETEKLNKAEKGVVSFFTEISRRYHNPVGWGLKFDNMTGRMICNMPMGSAGRYQQMVRFMPDPVWAKWTDLPSRCWAWLDEQLFIGTDDGRVLEVNDRYLSDNIRPSAAVRGRTTRRPASSTSSWSGSTRSRPACRCGHSSTSA
jgi:hypothetical protein